MTRRKKGRTTIADVAARAEVSPITVSRALREPARVSEPLRQRIDAAVQALNYVPDLHARALASARTNVVGVLIPSISNVVFADVLRGLHDRAESTDLQVQFSNTRYSLVEEERLIQLYLSQSPAAMIVVGIDQTPAAARMLREADLPVVQIMELGPDPFDMMVGLSQFDAGRALGEHLLSAGYRRIAFLAARLDPRSNRRMAGFRALMAEHGLDDDSLIVQTKAPSSVAMGCDLLRRLMRQRPDVDAVFCNNDDIALGALFECQRLGIKVPEQLGIAGFNDFEMMAAAEPPVTSVATERYEMGVTAMDMVARTIAGEPPEQKIVDIGFHLCPRASTRPGHTDSALQAKPAAKKTGKAASQTGAAGD
jgi:LacI family transcriptional regulator, gluconate utilization system Gnt-I transcriptional repressor